MGRRMRVVLSDQLREWTKVKVELNSVVRGEVRAEETTVSEV